MSLPTLVKTWEVEGSQQAGGSSNALLYRDIMWILKQNMIGEDTAGASLAYTNPWIVESSSDGAGVFGNNDLVDHWADNGDLVWANTGTNHSWIVLKNAVTGVQVCIDLDFSLSRFIHLSWSESAGYGVANGGTDGTATDRPTATDQRTLINTTTWCSGSSTQTHAVVHTWQSTDGECTRACVLMFSQPVLFWAFDKAKNAVTGFSGNYSIVRASTNTTSSCVTFALLAGTSNAFGRDGATNFDIYLATEMFGVNSEPYIGSEIPKDDVDGYVDFTSITLVGESPRRGEHGECSDMWYGNNFRGSGHSWPADLTRQFVQFGDLVLPWDGSAIQVVG